MLHRTAGTSSVSLPCSWLPLSIGEILGGRLYLIYRESLVGPLNDRQLKAGGRLVRRFHIVGFEGVSLHDLLSADSYFLDDNTQFVFHFRISLSTYLAEGHLSQILPSYESIPLPYVYAAHRCRAPGR